jgi:hypothetical protein
MWIYNNVRPHQGLNNLTPHEFLLKYGKPYLKNIEGFSTFQQDNDDENQWKNLILKSSCIRKEYTMALFVLLRTRFINSRNNVRTKT